MTDELEIRLAAARTMAELSTEDLAHAILANDPTTQLATGRFVPPSGTLALADLTEAQRATDAAIALLEARLSEVAADVQRLPRPTTPPAETGSRIDVSG